MTQPETDNTEFIFKVGKIHRCKGNEQKPVVKRKKKKKDKTSPKKKKKESRGRLKDTTESIVYHSVSLKTVCIDLKTAALISPLDYLWTF